MSLGKCLDLIFGEFEDHQKSYDFETLINLGKLCDIKIERIHAHFFFFFFFFFLQSLI